MRATAASDTEEITRFRRCLEGVLGIPATEGNAIDVLRNGDEIFPALYEAIDGATRTIDFLTYVYWEGEVGAELAARLCARAEAGVRVRILLDGLGARTIDPSLLDALADAGVDVRWFRPLRRFRPSEVNHRTHRKVLVVDERIGFTGGVGIADVWAGDARDETQWRDTHFRVRGPAVDGLRAAFLDNWAENTPELFTDVDQYGRSVAWDEEVNLVALDPALTEALDRQFDEDLARAERIEPERRASRPLAQRVGETLVRPVRRWF